MSGHEARVLDHAILRNWYWALLGLLEAARHRPWDGKFREFNFTHSFFVPSGSQFLGGSG